MRSCTILGLSIITIGITGACDRNGEEQSRTQTRPVPPTTAPDNTERNKADRDPTTTTPVDQSNSSEDVKLVAAIRRAIMDDKAMSVNAQNCKIIADKTGTVTLRGPVDSQAEKDAIESKAKAVAGVSRVINELEVKTK